MWTIQSSPHLDIWAESVHIDVAIEPEFFSKFQRQLLLDFRWEITQGIAQSQLPKHTHTKINKRGRTRCKRNGGKWVALNFNQTQLEACLSCHKDNAIQKAKLTQGSFIPASLQKNFYWLLSFRFNWSKHGTIPFPPAPQICMEGPWRFDKECSILPISSTDKFSLLETLNYQGNIVQNSLKLNSKTLKILMYFPFKKGP